MPLIFCLLLGAATCFAMISMNIPSSHRPSNSPAHVDLKITCLILPEMPGFYPRTHEKEGSSWGNAGTASMHLKLIPLLSSHLNTRVLLLSGLTGFLRWVQWHVLVKLWSILTLKCLLGLNTIAMQRCEQEPARPVSCTIRGWVPGCPDASSLEGQLHWPLQQGSQAELILRYTNIWEHPTWPDFWLDIVDRFLASMSPFKKMGQHDMQQKPTVSEHLPCVVLWRRPQLLRSKQVQGFWVVEPGSPCSEEPIAVRLWADGLPLPLCGAPLPISGSAVWTYGSPGLLWVGRLGHWLLSWNQVARALPASGLRFVMYKSAWDRVFPVLCKSNFQVTGTIFSNYFGGNKFRHFTLKTSSSFF